MASRFRSRWINLLQTLWFVPSVIAALYIGLAFGLLRVDHEVQPRGSWVFGGGEQAARTVLATIAGSLITVAGLTLSISMVVLQLTSSQFSPRVVRNYLGDRVAQATIGSFVGIFAYCLLAMRSVGFVRAGTGFVPRLTVTISSLLALVALALLIAFIHHIAQLVQASELTARIARATLASIDELYPEPHGQPLEHEDPDALVAQWRSEGDPGVVLPDRPGFVQRVELDPLLESLSDHGVRVHVLVAPGDFAAVDTVLAEVWPRERADDAREEVSNAVTVAGERDFDQDTHFGVRQLTDIALRAISPAVNDPTTAATCIGYLRSALVRLASRSFPARVRVGDDEPLVARRREFAEYVEALAEIGRYASGDARIATDVLIAARAVADAAVARGADDRADTVREIAEAVAEQALEEVRSSRDRRLVANALDAVGS